MGGGEKYGSALANFSGVSLDLFSDGVMIGTGTVINPALAFCWPSARSQPTSPKASLP